MDGGGTATAELGFYALAGAPDSPRAIIDEVRDAEALGLGTAFISERFDVKEAATLSGAAAAASSHINIATAATNQTTRHPLVTASFATTMHRLTGGRFSLGLGRGIDVMFQAYGIPKITTKAMEDFAGLMRRLWKGETVLGHADALGSYPSSASTRRSPRTSRSRSSPSDRTRWPSADGPSTPSSSTRTSPTRPRNGRCGR